VVIILYQVSMSSEIVNELEIRNAKVRAIHMI